MFGAVKSQRSTLVSGIHKQSWLIIWLLSPSLKAWKPERIVTADRAAIVTV
jgi:hypothetical protein